MNRRCPLGVFFRLPLHEKALFTQAVFLVAALRAGLLFLPLVVVRRALRLFESRPRRFHSPTSVLRAVERAARVGYLDNCLAKALAARALLARSGHAATLRVGTAPRGARLDAHAWLEREGEVVMGGGERSARYSPFPELERVLS